MKKLTYKLENEEEILLSEEITDEQGNSISLTEFGKGTILLTTKAYNSNNALVRVSSLENDQLLNAIEYDYDDAGLLIERRHFIGDEVYEKVQTEYLPDGLIRITIQDGEEVEKCIEKGTGKNVRSEFYQQGELIEYHISEKDARENKISRMYYDSSDKLWEKEVDFYDRRERHIASQKLSENDKILRSIAYKYEGDSLIETKTIDYQNEFQSSIITCEYDRNNHLLKKETKELTGKLMEFQSFAYDNRGRCMEEVHVSQGGGDPFSGGGESMMRLHLVHKFE